MRIAIAQLLELWEEHNLAGMRLKMLLNAVKDSQVYVAEGKNIQTHVDCTKPYLEKLKEKSADAHVEFNPVLMALLKKKYPASYRGIYDAKGVDKLLLTAKQLESMNALSRIQRQMTAKSNLTDEEAGELITDGMALTVPVLNPVVKRFAGVTAPPVEYMLSEWGIMLVCSNRMEDSRLKWFTMRHMETFDGVRVQAVVNAKNDEPLVKIEVLNLVNHYKNCRPRVVVLLPGVSSFAAKELTVLDRFVRIVRPSAAVIENEADRTAFLDALNNAYYSDYAPLAEANPKDEPAVLDEEERKKIMARVRDLDAAYSHAKYIDFMYTMMIEYARYPLGALLSQAEKVREKKELSEGVF
ncbi:MAG: hypothetical protein HZC28_13600 [Spirochaetes bacterium]|nr:hypothetical protein [Spirochaetota bacterium]